MIENNHRYVALDVFRGLAIGLMILVNTPGDWGSVYSPLLHSEWEGLTPTDLVFPFFLYIVGASIFFAFREQGFLMSKPTMTKVLRRFLILFALGLALNCYNAYLLNQPNVRVMGVLQRISICYLLGTILIFLCKTRALYAICILALIGYNLLFVLLGGDEPYSLDRNILALVDSFFLGEERMWKINGTSFEPEGLLSSIPATVTLIFGFESARRLSSYSEPCKALYRLMVWGGLCLSLGYYLAQYVPINKNLWSVPFVFISGGFALWVLAFCVVVADVFRWSPLVYPLKVYGSNSLFIYCLSWLLATLPYAITIDSAGGKSLVQLIWLGLQPALSPRQASLSFALFHVVAFWAVSWALYKKKTFIKI